MPMIRPHLVLVASSFVLLAACGDGGPAATAAPAASGNTPAAAAPATATAEAAAPAAPATVVEIKPRGAGEAKKIAVVLPPGVVDMSERPVMKQFRKGKDDFDGYALTLAEDEPMRAKGGIALMKGMLEKEKANPAKKVRVIDEATWEGGWALAYEFEEGGKKNVSVMASTTVGGTAYMCRGDASGSVLAEPGADAAAKVLVASCRSLKPGA